MQKLSSGVYASGENNVVSLIQSNPDSADTPEAYATDKDVAMNMGDYMLESM